MFAVLHLPQFALQAALRHQPDLWTKPVALVDPALNTPRVCDVTPPARALGVEEGLTPTQALARCRDVLIRHRSTTQEAAAVEAMLQCAYGFSPNIENTLPGTVTLDLRGLSEFTVGQASSLSRSSVATPLEPSPDRLEACPTPWAERLRLSLASLNLRACIGIGPTPNVARHAAFQSAIRHPPSAIEQGLPSSITIVEAPERFIASLPVAALDPSTDVADILRKWGIRTVGEMLALGQDPVADRLGLEALALFAAASATATRPLHLVQPAERYEESFEFEHEVETMEPLLFLLKRFVDHLSQRLELAGLAAELLVLRLRLDSGEVLERRLRVPEPTRRADVLFRMLQTHLETLRTNSPIVSVALAADPTQPGQKQFGLFESALRDPQQFQETLARLSALVGADRVGTPIREDSHRPDAFKLVPPDFENAPGLLTEQVAGILRVAPVRKLRPVKTAKVEFEEGLSRSNVGTLNRVRLDDQGRFNASTPPANIVDLIGPLFSAPSGPEAAHASAQVSPDEKQRTAALQDAAARSNAPAILCPTALRCAVANGKLALALGPWCASGRWWEPGAWQREEWDVQTRDGKALRLVRQAEGWFVEGIVD